MVDSEYLVFTPALTSGKTGVWNVLSLRHDALLGQIKWYGAWRQYCFFPAADTIFNPGCMDDIKAFIGEQMAARCADRSKE